MDVSSMIRVNELAKELKDKGIASSSEEASKIAAQYIQKGSMPEGSKKTDDIQKHEILLERVQRKFNSEISSVKEQLTTVLNELNSVKEDLKKLKQAPIVSNRPIEPSIKEPKQETLPKSESNQRTGQLKPGDVNIEDYFYFGDKNKKQ